MLWAPTATRSFRLAYLNSTFESGVKNPLDEAILAHRKLDVSGWQKIDEVPFDFERRRISVLIDDGSTRLLVVKGAPEDIVSMSIDREMADGTRATLDGPARKELLKQFERLGEEGYRALAVASRALSRMHASAAISDETELTFAGYLAFVDFQSPTRPLRFMRLLQRASRSRF